MKQLSIIIPVYNVEKYIYFCLESIFRQKVNRRCYEIIIINDGSNDKSIEAINDFASSYDNIIIINQDNQGVAAARNNGIKKANGKYTFLVDEKANKTEIKEAIHKLFDVNVEEVKTLNIKTKKVTKLS